MQVDVHGVDAEVAGPHPPDDGVEVGPVAVEVTRPPRGSGGRSRSRRARTGRRCWGWSPSPRRRPGPAWPRGRRGRRGRRRSGRSPPPDSRPGRRWPGWCRGRRSGASTVRARVAPGLVRRADGQQAAELAVRAGLGRERHRRHAGQGLQPVGQLRPSAPARPGRSRLRLQRVDVGEARQARHLLVQARVVLHGARAQRIDAPGRWRGSSGSGARSGAASRARRGPAGRSARRGSGRRGREASSSASGRSTPVLSQPPSSKISGSSCSRPWPPVGSPARSSTTASGAGGPADGRAWSCGELLRSGPRRRRRCRRRWWSRWRRPAARRPGRRRDRAARTARRR